MIEEYSKQINTSTTLKFEASKVNTIREKKISMLSCRVFKDQKIFSSNALGEMSEDQLKANALENPFGAIDYHYELNANEKIEVIGGIRLDENQVVEASKNLVEQVQSELPEFLLSGKMEYLEKEQVMQNSLQGHYSECLREFEGFLILKKKGSPNIMDSVLPVEAKNGSVDLANSKLFFDIHRRFDQLVTLEQGKYPVVFVMDYVFLNKFKEGLNPVSYHNNSCYYGEKLGQKIFNQKINLMDTRFNEEKGLFFRFDDEGNKLEEKLPLIENGVFKNIFYDMSAAKRFGKNCSGNGRREYNTAIRPSAYHVDFETTGETTQELIDQYEKIIIAVLAGGGDTSSNGEFSTPVQVAFLIEKGEIAGRLENLTVGNSIDKMMGEDFIAVPKDQMVPIKQNAFVAMMNTF